MRVSRLYTPDALSIKQTIQLDEDNAHYVRTVLRLKKDAKLILFNGQGGEYLCTVLEVSRKAVRIAIEQWQDRSVESPLQLHLGLAISRGDRMDFSVQKSVELGVTQITPLITERCVIQFNEEKKAQRLTHWQKIAQHAAEQSGRTNVPDFYAISLLSDWLDKPLHLKIMLDPYAKTTLNQLTSDNANVTLLTGPEGGFSEIERRLAIDAGFIPVCLGQRILRTETASLAALAAIQLLWGDFAHV